MFGKLAGVEDPTKTAWRSMSLVSCVEAAPRFWTETVQGEMSGGHSGLVDMSGRPSETAGAPVRDGDTGSWEVRDLST